MKPMNRKRQTEKQEEQKQGKLAWEIYSVLRDFSVILAAVAIIFVFLVRLVGVSGSSMYPTLMSRDYMLLLSNFLCGEYEQGDIVVLTAPDYNGGKEPLVKRIIATEGQKVFIDFENSIVYVDDVALEEDYIADQDWHRSYGVEGPQFPLTVPEDCVFVLGDNRDHSADSRYNPIGMVHTEYIMGKVLCICFPGQETNERDQVIGDRDFSRIGAVS